MRCLNLSLKGKRLRIEFKIREKVRKLKAEAALAERKAELIQDDDSDDLSSPNGENKSSISNKSLPVKNTQLTKIEQTELWAKSCPSVTSNDRAAFKNLEPTWCDDDKPKRDDNRNDMVESKTGKNEHGSLHHTKTAGCENPKPEASKNLDGQAVMLKVNMLQAMQPVKFDANPADFPTFRKRLIDKNEDGILNDSQKIEFLPKFVSGEAYETVKRVTGCSYPDIVAILQERYGQPARVAASCIESLISGPKLTNTDYKGLRNFAEQLTSSVKRLDTEYEQEASTTSNLNLIAARLPSYLINKWGDASYSIRESGR
ncbi:uncharacterized protein LOC114540222 [Dendronephthya gigantea]|uniref:uncharacterized protein LOC114540222 n=1 Tax=Dendronephthya gigantea TaxID=151771 RepID=UPI00106CB855|nr:uncharacterized protein LOC114540222 [Dendronephthya gigantea]